ncbi:MAG: hypothetical protein JWO05_2546 [Gemmatimonadetes bacterium]|nr:hypothetical protein [Gemmatimonadota bacterium]
MTSNLKKWVLVPVAIAAAACSKSAPQDDALRNDLALAAQSQQYQPQQFVSPQEAGYAPQAGSQYGYAQPQRVYTAARPAATTRRASTARSTGSSSGVYQGSGQGSQGTTVQKNTKRDAIIGGVTGAAIGAVTSRDKMKGAVIGGVAGAILGGVLGNNVDVKRVP